MLAAFRRAYKERKEARASVARADAPSGKAAEQVAASKPEEPAAAIAAPASQAPQKRR
jgi:hypothetical protein